MKKTRKLIAILLTVLTVMSVISAATPVFAVEITEMAETMNGTTEIVSEEQNLNDGEKESEILYEDISRRDKYTKHFVMSNGLNKAVKYAQPIHYKENDEWLDIDNTLEYNQETYKYENQANSFKVNFDKKIKSEELFSIENKGYTMSWKYNSSTKCDGSTGEIEKNSSKDDKAEKHKPKANGKIKYDKFETNTNLEYIVTGTGVKENIILESYTGKNSFSFEVKAKGLNFVKNQDKSISVVNQSCEEIFYIPAPFMYDADNNYCYDVEYSIESKKNKTILSVIADKEWLEDKERKYPVTIDPVITTQRDRTDIDSTFIASDNPSTNYYETNHLSVGWETSDYGHTRTLVKFTLPKLNTGDIVIGASLNLAMYYKSFYTSTIADQQINAHIITDNWDAETVTWATKPKNSNVVLDYDFFSNDGEGEWNKFDVTRAVKGWYEETFKNYGIMLKQDIEDGTYAENGACGWYWTEKYNSETDIYPVMEISYRNNKGLESYWDYSSFGVGAAGTAHVNDYTGNLVYELPIASSISEIMPVSIVGYYNNYCANELISETEAKDVRTSIGRGFRLNYQQTVLPSSEYIKSETVNEKYPYVYTDGDGTEHYIQKIIEKEKNDDGEEVEKTVYKDEDGLGLTLTTGFDDDGNKYYKIKDKAHNTYYFNFRGNLSRIKDKNGNELKIIYKDADSGNDLLDRSRISQIIDGAGHKYSFKYYVKSSTGVELDYVESITDDAKRKIAFDISNGLLRKVSYYDDNEATFEYQINSNDPTDRRINAVYSNGIYGLGFVYTSLETGRRVKKVTEYGESSVQGQAITFNRSNYNTTIMRACGVDGVHNNSDDIITTVQYDNMGRAVSQQMKFGSGDEIGAGSVAYTTSDSDESASGFKNKVSGSGATGKYVGNLLYGGNGENLDDWSFIKKGEINAETSLSSASKYIGKKSLKIAVNDAVKNEDRCYLRQSVTNFTPGEAYTLSAYVKTGDLVSAFESESTGAYIAIIAYNSDDEAIAEAGSQRIAEKTSLDVNNGWRRLSAIIETPENTSYLRCFLGLKNSEGSVCFDGIQLEKGSSANDYNMLENTHFTNVNGNAPISWSNAGDLEFSTGTSVTNGVVATKNASGDNTYAMKIIGEPNALNAISQTVTVEGNPDDTYILSGWAKANAVNTTFHTELTKGKDTETTEDDEYTGNALFEIGVRVDYSVSDGTTDKQYKTSAKFNTTISDWQCASVPISLKYTGGESDKTYTPTSIRIIPKYKNQENCAFFDKIMLVKDAASSYTYDNDGNLVSASSNSEQKNSMEYDDNNNLTSYKDTAGNKIKLTYDKNHNLQTQKSAKGVKTEYTYNNSGLPRTTEIHDGWLSINSGKEGYVAPTMAIKTGQTYFADDSSTAIDEGAFVNATYDENKNATTYTYNYKTGNLLTITNPKGVVTTNTYSGESTRPSTTTIKNSRVYYTYDSANRLDAIKFGKYFNGAFDTNKYEKYYFKYDEFGNIKQTLVGSQPLSTNTYEENNGVLKKTVYGNGDSRRFTYNNLGQRRRIYSKDGTASEKLLYSWVYNDSGVTTAYADRENDIKILYDYDSLGRFSKTVTQDRNTAAFIGSAEFGYDVRNNLTNLITNYGGKSHNQRYYYSKVDENSSSGSYEKDNLPTMYKLYNSRYAIYDYDSLNRLTQRDFSTDAHLFYNYTYKKSDNRNTSGSEKYQTTQVKEEYIGDDVYIYGYDVLGNITSIKKSTRSATGTGTLGYGTAQDYVTYSYDDLGQLTEENFLNNKTRNTWTYDELGNITSRNEYTTDETTEKEKLSKTVTYGYGNDGKTGWNNLLVSVDKNGNGTQDAGESITYDEIGNPTTYLGTSLTWNGRQLTSYSKNLHYDILEYSVDGLQEISYKYDGDGLRRSKTEKLYSVQNETQTLVQTTETSYAYANGKLHYQKTKITNSEGATTNNLYFFYDSNGYLTGIDYNDINYYPATNRRGDVIAIYDRFGNCVAKYEYDAWGNVISVIDCDFEDEDGNIVKKDITNDTTSTDIAMVNPIRYRGYYYDTETELYYLQSRYYNAEVGRFLNSDSISDSGAGVLGFNTFIYCANNPVNASDPSGHWIIKNAIKWVAEKVSNGVNRIKEKTSNLRGTYQKGVTGSAAFILEGTISVGVAVDLQGNIGITSSYGGGGGSPNASVSAYRTITNAPNIDKLQGGSFQIGGSVNVVPVSVGVEYTGMQDSTNGDFYHGVTTSAGVGLSIPAPGEIHTDITNTHVASINIYDEIDRVCVKIMEW